MDMVASDVGGVEEPLFVRANTANCREYDLAFFRTQSDRRATKLGPLVVT